MKVIALVSGGKDSTFNMMECIKNGHEIVALVNLRPPNSQSVKNERLVGDGQDNQDELVVQELDSFMYQSVGNEIIDLYAQAMQVPIYRAEIIGKVKNTGLEYEPTDNQDEVEDLYRILACAKNELEAKNGWVVVLTTIWIDQSTVLKCFCCCCLN